MRPYTKWELFKKRFVFGQWSWFTFIVRKHVIVIGKFKYIRKEK